MTNMKKLLLSCLTLLTSLTIVSAQSNGTLLYKISGNDLSEPSYLYGTIHLMCEKDFAISDQLKAALVEVDQYVLELDMDDPSMMMKMQQNMMMKEGKKLSDLLEADEYTMVKTYFAENLGMPLDQMGMIKPFMLSSMIYPAILGCPIKSYEMELVQSAKANSKEVLGLETVEFQLGIFDQVSYEEQADMLLETVEEVDLAKKEFGTLVEAYKKGDAQLLLQKMEESTFEMSDEMMEMMLPQRNQNWIPKITEIATEKSSLFAVGAGHLAGERGVVNLLKKAGFDVTPVN